MIDLINRVQTLAGAAVTWLVLASVVLTAVLGEVGDDIPALAEWGGKALAFLAVAIAIVRRVSPVEPTDRGLLT